MGRKKLPSLEPPAPLAPYSIDDFREWRFQQRKAVEDRRWNLGNQLCRAVSDEASWRLISFTFLFDLIDDGYKIVSYPDGIRGYTRAELEAELKKMEKAWAGAVKIKIRKFTGAIQAEYKAVCRPKKKKT